MHYLSALHLKMYMYFYRKEIRVSTFQKSEFQTKELDWSIKQGRIAVLKSASSTAGNKPVLKKMGLECRKQRHKLDTCSQKMSYSLEVVLFYICNSSKSLYPCFYPYRLPGLQKTLSSWFGWFWQWGSIPGRWPSKSEGRCCGQQCVWIQWAWQQQREEQWQYREH